MSGELEAWCEVSRVLGADGTGLAVPLLGLRPGAWLIEDQVLYIWEDLAGLLKQVECFCFMMKRVFGAEFTRSTKS